MDGIETAGLATIGSSRIFFGHHSVGSDILHGLGLLAAEAGAPQLPLVRLPEETVPDGPALLHASVGANKDPASKLRDFVRAVDDELPRDLDFAFMKFCYVDMDPFTDPDELFEHYWEALEGLRARHPGIRFLHLTTPLMVRDVAWKDRLNRMLGRMVWGDDANAVRDDWNAKLRAVASADHLVDVALAEATRPDGEQTTFSHRGRTRPCLFPGYARDRGHLNDVGAKAVGRTLLRVLGGLAKAESTD